jgi:hypothetical protein
VTHSSYFPDLNGQHYWDKNQGLEYHGSSVARTIIEKVDVFLDLHTNNTSQKDGEGILLEYMGGVLKVRQHYHETTQETTNKIFFQGCINISLILRSLSRHCGQKSHIISI